MNVVDDHRGLAGKLILVVDDDDCTRKVIADLLQEVGADIRGCGDGAQALSQLAEQRFDGIVLDLIMPVMDGFETLRRLRAHQNTIPVIAVTGSARGQEALPLGVRACLSKPFTRDQFLAAISQYF